jgi:hypothetical protein
MGGRLVCLIFISARANEHFGEAYRAPGLAPAVSDPQDALSAARAWKSECHVE